MGGSHGCSICSATTPSCGRRSPSLPHQCPEPGDRRSVHAHRHAVQGGGRHPLLRPARGQGRDGIPACRRQPGRRGQRQACARCAQARRRRRQRCQARCARRQRGRHVCRGDAARQRGRSHRIRGTRYRLVRELLDRLALRRRRVGPGDLLQAAFESGYLAELEADGSVEAAGRIENLGELVGSAREFTALDEFLEQVALVADTDDLDGRRPRGADDSALGERSGVSRSVPRGYGRGCVPSQQGSHRTGR